MPYKFKITHSYTCLINGDAAYWHDLCSLDVAKLVYSKLVSNKLFVVFILLDNILRRKKCFDYPVVEHTRQESSKPKLFLSMNEP